ncbi:MAG: transcriptional regulator [Gloeobacteraceae cyanobacterium ES-bin-316]|nr:transcriptional regulator [Ferruginibacter sp.]
MEAKDEIDDALHAQLSAALKIPVEAIKYFDEEAAVVNIQNNCGGANLGATTVNAGGNIYCTFNPIDKLVEVMDENKRLFEELLRARERQIEMMRKMLGRQTRFSLGDACKFFK